nr:hypothetical protein JVH1_6964 [Rhodococcus sp. JVH1]
MSMRRTRHTRSTSSPCLPSAAPRKFDVAVDRQLSDNGSEKLAAPPIARTAPS